MFLGIDCGTQGTKALIVDDAGRTLGRGHAAHDLIERASGAREQEPSWWVTAMITAVRAAVADAGVSGRDIVALGVSGQQHGLVVLDDAGLPIWPAKLWNDTETAPQNDALIEGLGGAAAWFDQLGIVPRTGYTISKLLWLKEKEPDSFRRIRRILLPHDYLNHWLTGRAVAEYGDASGTGFFDIRRRTWATAPLDLIDGGSGLLAARAAGTDRSRRGRRLSHGCRRRRAWPFHALPGFCRRWRQHDGRHRHRQRSLRRRYHQPGHLGHRLLLRRPAGHRRRRLGGALLLEFGRLATADLHHERHQRHGPHGLDLWPRHRIPVGGARRHRAGSEWPDAAALPQWRADTGPSDRHRAVSSASGATT